MNKTKMELTPSKELEIAKRVWKFFLKAHPDADIDAVVDLIINETREITIREMHQME